MSYGLVGLSLSRRWLLHWTMSSRHASRVAMDWWRLVVHIRPHWSFTFDHIRVVVELSVISVEVHPHHVSQWDSPDPLCTKYTLADLWQGTIESNPELCRLCQPLIFQILKFTSKCCIWRWMTFSFSFYFHICIIYIIECIVNRLQLSSDVLNKSITYLLWILKDGEQEVVIHCVERSREV